MITLSGIDNISGIKQREWYENWAWTTRALTTTNGVWTITYTAERNLELRFRAIDNAGNISDEITTWVKLDKTAPSAWTISINNGAAYTTSATVTLTLSASDAWAGMWKMRFSCNNSTWSAWENYATSKSWTFNTSNGCTATDGTKTVYVQYQDALWNGTKDANDTIILDTVAPNVWLNNSSTDWKKADISIKLTANDATSWLSGDKAKYYWTTSTTTTLAQCWANWTQYTSWTTITDSTEWTRYLYVCAYDKAWNSKIASWTYKLDKTYPVCGTWTYQPQLTTPTNGTVTATLANSTDGVSWIATAWWSCTISEYNGTCSVTITDNAWNSTWCTSAAATNIDSSKPTVTLTSTATIRSTTQTVTWTCTDNVWVTAYYRWTTANPVDDDYIVVTPATTNFTVTKTINTNATYYLICKDTAWNTWSASKTFQKYTTYSRLDKITWTQWIYNPTNYSNAWTRWAYYIPNGTVITLSDIYYVPTCSTLQWWWWSDTLSSLNTATTVNVNNTKWIHLFFNRNMYDLTVTAWTWIESVSGSGTYKYGETIWINAEVKPGYTFSGWTKVNGTDLTTFTATTNEQNVQLAYGPTIHKT